MFESLRVEWDATSGPVRCIEHRKFRRVDVTFCEAFLRAKPERSQMQRKVIRR